LKQEPQKQQEIKISVMYGFIEQLK